MFRAAAFLLLLVIASACAPAAAPGLATPTAEPSQPTATPTPPMTATSGSAPTPSPVPGGTTATGIPTAPSNPQATPTASLSPTATARPAPTATPDNRKLGGEVGNRAPAFILTTLDGGTVSLESALAARKPVLLYFFTSWCPQCRADLKTLKELEPTFRDKLTMVLISFDGNEGKETLRQFLSTNGYTWATGMGNQDILSKYGVFIQSTKIALNPDGVVVFRAGYGALSKDQWRKTLADITG